MSFFKNLEIFLRHLKISIKEFCETIEVSPQSYQNWRHGKDVKLSQLSRILHNYPQLNADWLLNDRGQMLFNSYEKKEPQPSKLSEPVIPQRDIWSVLENMEKEIEKLKEQTKNQPGNQNRQNS